MFLVETDYVYTLPILGNSKGSQPSPNDCISENGVSAGSCSDNRNPERLNNASSARNLVVILIVFLCFGKKLFHWTGVRLKSARGPLLDGQQSNRTRGGSGAVLHTQLSKYLLEMFVNRPRAHVQNLANFPVGFAIGDPQ